MRYDEAMAYLAVVDEMLQLEAQAAERAMGSGR